MKKLVLILSALLLCLGMAYAEDAEVWEPEIYTEGIYEYIYVAYGVKITRINFGDELPKALVLPSELGEEGDPLLGIGDNVFSYFCIPGADVSVSKARLATEELYKMRKFKTKKVSEPEPVA